MTTLTLTASKLCKAGNHFQLTVTGDVSYVLHTSADEVMAPVTEEDKEAFLRVFLRLYARGKTRNQVKQALVAGLEFTL
jgi:hypothetical protein